MKILSIRLVYERLFKTVFISVYVTHMLFTKKICFCQKILTTWDLRNSALLVVLSFLVRCSNVL